MICQQQSERYTRLFAASADIAAGTVHVAVPFDSGWSLNASGAEVDARPAFGSTVAFDVAQAGPVTLEYRTSSTVRARRSSRA